MIERFKEMNIRTKIILITSVAVTLICIGVVIWIISTGRLKFKADAVNRTLSGTIIFSTTGLPATNVQIDIRQTSGPGVGTITTVATNTNGRYSYTFPNYGLAKFDVNYVVSQHPGSVISCGGCAYTIGRNLIEDNSALAGKPVIANFVALPTNSACVPSWQTLDPGLTAEVNSAITEWDNQEAQLYGQNKPTRSSSVSTNFSAAAAQLPSVLVDPANWTLSTSEQAVIDAGEASRSANKPLTADQVTAIRQVFSNHLNLALTKAAKPLLDVENNQVLGAGLLVLSRSVGKISMLQNANFDAVTINLKNPSFTDFSGSAVINVAPLQGFKGITLTGNASYQVGTTILGLQASEHTCCGQNYGSVKGSAQGYASYLATTFNLSFEGLPITISYSTSTNRTSAVTLNFNLASAR